MVSAACCKMRSTMTNSNACLERQPSYFKRDKTMLFTSWKDLFEGPPQEKHPVDLVIFFFFFWSFQVWGYSSHSPLTNSKHVLVVCGAK